MTGATPRRDNGLHATSYDRLADVETHLVDGLLERLRDEDVAAYSAPAAGRRGPYGDTVLPQAPSDSVYVDSRRRDRAREVIDTYLDEMAAEMAWAGIVADFEREAVDPVPRWPVSEDVDDASDDLPSPDHPRTTSFEALRDGRPAPADDPLSASDLEAREDHFEPPPPPPLPSVDPVTRFAWAGVLGGPVVMVLAALAGLPLSGWVGFLALLAFMTGFVTLVARMQDRPPTDSGPDDGAVV